MEGFTTGRMHTLSLSLTHTNGHGLWIAKVMQQSHQLCHRASVCLCPQLCFLMWSRSLSSNPFPLNAARSQPYFLISLFSLPCDSRMKLPSSSTWLFVSTLLNSAGAVTLAGFQMTSVLTKVTQRFRHIVVLREKVYWYCCCVAGQRSKWIPGKWTEITLSNFGKNS